MGRIRFAIRSLGKSPLFTLVVVLSLGLGTGVNTAIFSFLHQVVLSAMRIPHPEQLVLVNSPGDLKNRQKLGRRFGRHGLHFQLAYVSRVEKTNGSRDVGCFPLVQRQHRLRASNREWVYDAGFGPLLSSDAGGRTIS